MYDVYQGQAPKFQLWSPMKSIIVLFLCLLAHPLFAQSSYPPTLKDARVETYRKIGSTELKLWMFGESDPKSQKPAMVFFFGGDLAGPSHRPAHALYFARKVICITSSFMLNSSVSVLD